MEIKEVFNKKFAIGAEIKNYEVFIVEADTFQDAIEKIEDDFEDVFGKTSEERNYVDITDMVIEKIGRECFDDLQDTTGDEYDEEEEKKKNNIFNHIEWGNLVKGVFYDENEELGV